MYYNWPGTIRTPAPCNVSVQYGSSIALKSKLMWISSSMNCFMFNCHHMLICCQRKVYNSILISTIFLSYNNTLLHVFFLCVCDGMQFKIGEFMG